MLSSSTILGWQWQSGTSPNDLQLGEVRLGELEPHQVLVKNHFIGLNPVDWKVLEHPEALGLQPGKIPGLDGAGEVIAIGASVDSHWLGRRVAYQTSLGYKIGSFAEQTPVDVRSVMCLPSSLGFDVAASIPSPALTAWQALDKLPQQKGAKVLISGAGGGVGRYLVQLAVSKGYAVTTLSHERHWSRLKQEGALETLSSLQEDQTWQGDKDFFAVIDAYSPVVARKLTDALGANGHVVSILGRLSEWPCAAFGRCISMHEVALGALHVYGSDADWQHLMAAGEGILQEIDIGNYEAEPLIIEDFKSLPRHLEALKQRAFSGKALVRIV